MENRSVGDSVRNLAHVRLELRAIRWHEGLAAGGPESWPVEGWLHAEALMRGDAISRLSRKFVPISSRFWPFRDVPPSTGL